MKKCKVVLGSGAQMAPRWPHSGHTWRQAAKMLKWWSFCLKNPKPRKLSTLKWKLHGFEAHFELFWALVVKWLPDGHWRLILSGFELWWPSGSQMASGGSFLAVPGSGGQIALSGGSFRAVLGSGGQIGSQAASGTKNRGALVLKSPKSQQKTLYPM